MHDYCGKHLCSDPAKRAPLMVINKTTNNTCNYAADFTADVNFANTLESNVNINISDISNSETRYGKYKF